MWAVSGAVMLVCPAATQVSEERTGKQPSHGARRAEEKEDRASENIRNQGQKTKGVVASYEVSAHSKKLFQSEMSSENTSCPSWKEKQGEGEVLSETGFENCC